MRRRHWLPLFALVAALPACGKDSITGTKNSFKVLDCAKGVHYTVGQSVSGSLASGDCVDPSGTGRADYYQFSTTSAGPIAVTVKATPNASPAIINAILDVAGKPLHFALTKETGTSIIGGNLPAGTYVIVVAASQDNQTSSYTLTSSATLPPPPFDCASITPMILGSTVTGSFAPTDCKDPDGIAPSDYYSFTLAADGPVSFRLTPAADTAYLAVSDEDGNILGVAIADPTTPGVLGGNLPAGSYIAFAAGNRAGQTGSYSLASSASLASSPARTTVSPRAQSPWTMSKRYRW